VTGLQAFPLPFAPRREEAALAWLARPSWADVHTSGLNTLPVPWSAPVSSAVLVALARTATTDDPRGGTQTWRWTAQARDAAHRLHPDAPLPDLPGDADDAARTAWTDLAHTLRLRREIRLALTRSPA